MDRHSEYPYAGTPGLSIDDSRLSRYAASAARLLPCRETGGARGSVRLLRRQLGQIRRTHDALQRRYGLGSTPDAACEWLLDNWYMVLRESASAVPALCRARELRLTEGEPLILALCRSLVRAGQGRVSEERCLLFLDGFQTVTPLRRAELGLFPAALRAAVIGEIAAVCLSLPGTADTAPQAAALEALFGTLRLLSTLDTEKLLRAADLTGAILSADPSGDYPLMDAATQQLYLDRVERLAAREGLEESVYARQLIRRAKRDGRHVGFYLFPPERRWPARLYISLNLLLTLFLALLFGFALRSPLAALLLLIPLSELVKGLLDCALTGLLRPIRLPRMDMERGVPDRGRTLCVVSALLTDPDSARAQVRRLEELRLASRREGKNLLFGLLADLPVADTRETEADAALLDAARQELYKLNARYGGGFCLLHRERCFDGESWCGWERKRGALTELARLLCARPSSLHAEGDGACLERIRYLLALDSDTRLYPGAAGELIGCMLHPLARPQVDGDRGVVTKGRAVLQPRLDTELGSANATDFALIFAGPGGSDPYGGLCGELYMDAFGRSGFAGKGILDLRAYLACCEATIPEGRILSHDALEGACLRGGYVGDTAFSDAFPARPLAYFRRLHRWVRGDWQNLPWVFCRRFSDIDRWRLWDSLRRSLVPPLTLAAILAGFLLPEGALAVSAWAALLALLGQLFRALAAEAAARRSGPRLRRYTRLLTGAGGALVQSFVRLWLLPYEAWICLSAMLTALWRMLASHRRLLQWQTAAQSEQGSLGLWAHLRAMWPAAALGLALLLFSPAIIGRSAGLLWLLSPAAAAALALPAHRDAPLSAADRAYLRSAAGALFGYYRRFCTADDHWLPPDNFQAQPPVGLAHRSSPTNIGMALASCAAALDLELRPREELVSLIERILSSLERLPRCRGHFYNWYDTRSLAPLSPAYISTVDSGNLYACLLVLREALAELDERGLVARVAALMEPMDFSLLFDERRKLFFICYDAEAQRGAGGWYDLMASEAMLTSYLAVAKGDVPERHWRRLSRAQVHKDGYRGLVSWTGTMFEYLMPALFLPLYRGSLLHESGRFCLYVQKRRTLPARPWGVSESAFYALDAQLSYRYKANGCAALALKRGQDEDLVVSPYSSFLALALDPAGAVRNLRRLERLGALGRFGFIEAVDFTPERCRSGQGEPVYCFMAHHTGMSILAAANALCNQSIRRRFFADPAMRAYSLLLQERLPEGGPLLRRRLADPPPRVERRRESRWTLTGDSQGDGERLCLLSNGVYAIFADKDGFASARCGELSVYGCPGNPRSEPGMTAELQLEGRRVRLFPLEHADRWELSQDRCLWERQSPGLTALMSLSAAAGELGELRTLRLRAAENGKALLRLELRPLLTLWADYDSHPAYWRLGVCASQEDGALLLRRLRRGEHKELWLCLACDRPVRFALPPGGETGLCDARCALLAELELAPGREEELSLALCLGPDAASAREGAAHILASREAGDMVGAAAARLGLDAAGIGEAMALLGALTRPLYAAPPQRELWPHGISGDAPLLCCRAEDKRAMALLYSFCLLKCCGLDCELVCLCGDLGEYRQGCRRQIGEALAALGLEALIGSRGGVHFAPLSAENTLAARAAYVLGEPERISTPLPLPRLGRARETNALPPFEAGEGEFRFDAGNCLPPRAWQLPLSGKRLGALVCDCGMAGLWLDNARELRLTAPNRLPEDSQGQELVWVELAGERISLFAANDGLPCHVSFRPGAACWEKELPGRTLRTWAFMAPEEALRLLLVEGAGGLTLHWQLQPLLSSSDAACLRAGFDGGLFRAENPQAEWPGLCFLAGASQPCACRSAYTPPAMHLRLRAEDAVVLACGCCEADALRRYLQPEVARAELQAALSHWAERTGRLRVATGNGPLDRYLNGWAVYQVLACRLLGRASLYQSGGAFGFRDQLQDAVNLLLIDPSLARERLRDCCRHQYAEGDVMHWWHALSTLDKGLRSRCSDDLLWLPWALCEYTEATGDLALCGEALPYLSSPPLLETERDRYETCAFAGSATVLEHARAALDCCVRRGFGPHGLPRMGSGDWNDGLDAAGGESVWLGWFLSCVADAFAALLEKLGQDGADWRALSRKVGLAANDSWNGSFYCRGYLPDGSPLGGDGRLDILPQAWAALCPWADSARVDRALDACLARLVDRERRLVRLFDPPYGPEEPYVGYLSGYGRGFRENGGQYTHAAVWLALACLRRGRKAEGEYLLCLLLPENLDPARYRAEPFVLAADVSAAPGCEGLAGWTWYTGSAGWYYRTAVRELLGLRLRNGKLEQAPGAIAYQARYTDPEGRIHELEGKKA